MRYENKEAIEIIDEIRKNLIEINDVRVVQALDLIADLSFVLRSDRREESPWGESMVPVHPTVNVMSMSAAERAALALRREFHSFVMPFGKYKGLKLPDIITVPTGFSYLRWLATESNLDIHKRRMIGSFLDSLRPAEPPMVVGPTQAKPRPVPILAVVADPGISPPWDREPGEPIQYDTPSTIAALGRPGHKPWPRQPSLIPPGGRSRANGRPGARREEAQEAEQAGQEPADQPGQDRSDQGELAQGGPDRQAELVRLKTAHEKPPVSGRHGASRL